MRDFSAPHRGKVAYFGIWAEDGRDEQLGDIDAWNILCDAVRHCTNVLYGSACPEDFLRDVQLHTALSKAE